MSGILPLLFIIFSFFHPSMIILSVVLVQLTNYSLVLLCDRLKSLSPNLTVVKCPIVWFLKIGISMLRWVN